MLRSLASAFLMYSRIPMPKIEWKEENRRYALGFFPLVGAVCGGLLIAWYRVCCWISAGHIIFASGAILLQIAVTGGIHLDGFCDVTDARSSYGSRQKKLEIMSDPHIGSFAVIHIVLYLIVQTALFTRICTMRTAGVIACGYVLSRSASAISAVTLRSAKKSGTLQSFVEPSHRKITIAITIFFAICSAAGMVVLSPVMGIVCTVSAICVWIWCGRKAYAEFGGITGDVCGWALQLCEIWILAAAVFTPMIMEAML